MSRIKRFMLSMSRAESESKIQMSRAFIGSPAVILMMPKMVVISTCVGSELQVIEAFPGAVEFKENSMIFLLCEVQMSINSHWTYCFGNSIIEAKLSLMDSLRDVG